MRQGVGARGRGSGTRLTVVLGAALLMLAAGRRAWAGPPFITDDPEPVELHHWEVYLTSMYWNGKSGAFGTAPHSGQRSGVARMS